MTEEVSGNYGATVATLCVHRMSHGAHTHVVPHVPHSETNGSLSEYIYVEGTFMCYAMRLICLSVTLTLTIEGDRERLPPSHPYLNDSRERLPPIHPDLNDRRRQGETTTSPPLP